MQDLASTGVVETEALNIDSWWSSHDRSAGRIPRVRATRRQ